MLALTDRQRQVLCLVALSNREIAMRLGIGHQAVKNLLKSVYKRLAIDGVIVGKRRRALALALYQNVIALDEIEPPPPPPGWDRERFEQARAAAERELETGYAG